MHLRCKNFLSIRDFRYRMGAICIISPFFSLEYEYGSFLVFGDGIGTYSLMWD